jgi:redox-sensitive bicupin YhaK (pirin superfamily)
MTAGRGIVHSEMPEQEDGLMWGFQLWVNLPANAKMIAPRYQDVAPQDIPEVDLGDGSSVRIIAGNFSGTNGPVSAVEAQPIYLDLRLAANAGLELPLPTAHNGFVYCYAGDFLTVRGGAEGGRALLIAGRAFGEPIARYGPFVMNTREQIMEAIEDMRTGRC